MMILKWFVMASSPMTSGQLSSRSCRPWTAAGVAPGPAIGQRWEGIAWRYRTGSPWRDLPDQFGPWQTVWKRHYRWSHDGTYQKIFDVVRSAGLLAISASDDLDRFLSVDSTIVRAHHHAAGARKGGAVPEDLSTTPNETGGPVELHESAT